MEMNLYLLPVLKALWINIVLSSCLQMRLSDASVELALYLGSFCANRSEIVALWDGHLVQTIDSRGHLVYALYKNAKKGGFLNHLSYSRLGVPRYQNWLVFRLTNTLSC